jgi:hypothetical protein
MYQGDRMGFTQEQLDAAAELPVLIIHGVISVDGTTYSSVVRELMAIAKFVDEAQVDYANNLLVQAALLRFVDESGNVNTGLDSEKVEHIPPGDVLGGVDYVLNLFAALPELPGYKQFIYGLAEKIATAAGNGLLGTGAKVSDQEAALLHELQARLVV